MRKTYPCILGIGGCSGSGKTTLARELARQLDATLFPLDFYYRDLSHMPLHCRRLQNFDDPASLECDLIVQHLQTLQRGEPIDRPIYDFAAYTRIPNRTDRVVPTRFVLVEGILALHFPDLLPLYSLSIYVEANSSTCLHRRIHRDIHERGRTEESVVRNFERNAMPMAQRYVLPSRANADIVVDGCSNLDWSVEQIRSALRDKGLL